MRRACAVLALSLLSACGRSEQTVARPAETEGVGEPIDGRRDFAAAPDVAWFGMFDGFPMHAARTPGGTGFGAVVGPLDREDDGFAIGREFAVVHPRWSETPRSGPIYVDRNVVAGYVFDGETTTCGDETWARFRKLPFAETMRRKKAIEPK